MFRRNKRTASWAMKLLLYVVGIGCLLLLPVLWLAGKILPRPKELLQAALGGDVEQVTSLLEEGAEMDAVDEDGRTVLHIALDEGDLSIAAALLERGIDLNVADVSGRIPLDMLRTLSPDVIAEDTSGWRNCKKACVTIQLTHPEYSLGGIINQKLYKRPAGNPDDKQEQKSIMVRVFRAFKEYWLEEVLHRLSFHDAASSGNVRTLKRELKKGTNIHFEDKYGRTALHCALDGARFKAAAFLMERGADVYRTDALGRTPLDIITTIPPESIYWYESGWRKLRSCLEKRGETELAHSRDACFDLE